VNRPDPHREAFRILRAEPSLYLVELLWRWSFGLGVLAVIFFSLPTFQHIAYLAEPDQSLLQSHDPMAVAAGIAEVMQAARPLIVRLLVVALPVLALLWGAALTIGRGLTTRAIVRRLAAERGQPEPPPLRWLAMAGISFGRVAAGFILLIGYVGGSIISSSVAGSPENPNLLASALLFLLVFGAAFAVWSVVNWFLSLAPIFALRDGLGALDATVAAIRFVRGHRRQLRAAAGMNALLRTVAAVVLTIAGLLLIPLASAAPGWLIAVLAVLISLAYILSSDYLLLARLTGYAVIAMEAEQGTAAAESRDMSLHSPRPAH